MLTAEGCTARRERLWQRLARPCDALLIAEPQNLIYFANYHQSPFTFRSNDASALLILQPDKGTLVADNLLKPFIDRAYVDEVVAPVWYEGKQAAPERHELLVKSGLETLAKLNATRVGLEPAT